MTFLTEPEPIRRQAVTVAPGIRRLVADNPTPMTYHGTNCYLIDSPEGTLVLDPGPQDDPEQIEDIIRETDGAIAYVVLTHTHRDHMGAVAALCATTQAPVASYAPSGVSGFVPDFPLRDQDRFAGLDIIHTPGHAADHICLARDDGILFSGDQVMAWCSTVVGPEGGNMADFCASLRMLAEREDRVYLPGHGPALPHPQEHVRKLLASRVAREEAIERALHSGPASVPDLAARLYAKLNPTLRRASERNVTSHLLKLQREGKVRLADDLWTLETADTRASQR